LIIVIPLLIVSLVLLTIISVGLSRNGIDKVAKELLGFKINQILTETETQVKNLELFKDRPDYEKYVKDVKRGIINYSIGITKEGIESVVYIDSNGIIKMTTAKTLKKDQEADFFYKMQHDESEPSEDRKGWITFEIDNSKMVGFYRHFKEWNWYILLFSYSNSK
jgi:hypothetical protein